MRQVYQSVSNPTANITINKSRVKVYKNKQDTVYLKDKQEFEIELFNPTTNVICAEVSINGTKISNSALVLNPGQRVFLERYLDTPNKFQFSTYTVEKGNAAVDAAIAQNGVIEVKFFSEKVQPNYGTGLRTDIRYPWDNQIVYGNKTFFTGDQFLTSSSNISYSSTNDNVGVTLDACMDMEFEENSKGISEEKETGRVDIGSASDQSFTYSNKEFNPYAFHTAIVQILPLSEQQINAADVRNYCTECGAKLKGNFKFCPTCGTKI